VFEGTTTDLTVSAISCHQFVSKLMSGTSREYYLLFLPIVLDFNRYGSNQAQLMKSFRSVVEKQHSLLL